MELVAFSCAELSHWWWSHASELLVAKKAIFLLLLSALFIRYPIQPVSFVLGVSLLLLTCVIVTLSGSWTGFQEAGSDERKL